MAALNSNRSDRSARNMSLRRYRQPKAASASGFGLADDGKLEREAAAPPIVLRHQTDSNVRFSAIAERDRLRRNLPDMGQDIKRPCALFPGGISTAVFGCQEDRARDRIQNSNFVDFHHSGTRISNHKVDIERAELLLDGMPFNGRRVSAPPIAYQQVRSVHCRASGCASSKSSEPNWIRQVSHSLESDRHVRRRPHAILPTSAAASAIDYRHFETDSASRPVGRRPHDEGYRFAIVDAGRMHKGSVRENWPIQINLFEVLIDPIEVSDLSAAGIQYSDLAYFEQPAPEVPHAREDFYQSVFSPHGGSICGRVR
jgi:hypothetical protein